MAIRNDKPKSKRMITTWLDKNQMEWINLQLERINKEKDIAYLYENPSTGKIAIFRI